MGIKQKINQWLQAVRARLWLKRPLQALIILVVFLVGILVGNGSIAFHHRDVVATGLPSQLNYSTVNQVYQALKNNYDGQLTENQLLDGLKHGLAQATNDPYTEYFTASEAEQFDNQLNNSFSGIGAQLGADSQGNLQVIAPIPGSPADKAGLKAQDLIVSINGQSTTGMSVTQAVTKIQGKAGTNVTLGIVRGNQPITLTITRQQINAPSVITKVLPGNIGYMQILTFADDTSSLAQKAANQFKAEGVKSIILDLRDNPGGELTAAESVSSLWLPAGQTILQEKRGGQVIDTDQAQGGDILHGIPTVVLINGGSASASEITAGALHDNGDAYLIGQKSYGKGVVQEVICITGQANATTGACPADELKVTVASWYRPDGQNINHKGITPDQTVAEPSNANIDNDPQLQAAENYLANK